MQPLRIAIQGIASSFHDVAARKFFGSEIDIVPCKTFRQSCECLVNGQAEYCVMAIENSIAGSILTNYTIIHEARLRITGELYMPIELHLMALPGQSLAQINEIHSHPMAIRQCEDFLLAHPHWRVVALTDTAECARNVALQQLTGVGVIAGQQSARQFNLSILIPNIESYKKNFTRFLILSNKAADIPNANKASVSFQLDNAPHSLKQVVDAFTAADIRLTKIQSIPAPGRPDRYTLLVDLEWDNDHDFVSAMTQAIPATFNFSLLGQYKKGIITNAVL